MPGFNAAPHLDRDYDYSGVDRNKTIGRITDPDQPMVTSKRALGVGLAAVISLCIGLFLLLAFLVPFFQPEGARANSYMALVPAIIALVLSVALWQLYSWARIVGAIFFALLTILALISAFTSPFTLASFALIVLPVSVTLYLVSHRARLAFEQRDTI